ncbi:hypothetical protein LXL04_032521 [Taraxacum kok-saghyz]
MENQSLGYRPAIDRCCLQRRQVSAPGYQTTSCGLLTLRSEDQKHHGYQTLICLNGDNISKDVKMPLIFVHAQQDDYRFCIFQPCGVMSSRSTTNELYLFMIRDRLDFFIFVL